MAFSDIRDQAVAVRLLQSMLRKNRIPNGLLFYGPAGVGKYLAARELTKAINCAQAEADACDECLVCRKVMHANHPDVHTVVPVKKSRIIDVDAIENIIEIASLRPFEARWRVIIIRDAERMRGPAQNHLLKTLEEPLGNTLFILISEFPQFLLPTIRSRCQRVRFGALRPETVAEILQRDRDITQETALAIAAVSQGQVSRALDLVDSDKRTVVFDVVQRLRAGEDPLALAEEFSSYLGSQKSRLEAAAKEAEEPADRAEVSKEDRERVKEEQQALVDALIRRDIMEHLYLFETWYRDTLVYSATGGHQHILNRDHHMLLAEADVDATALKLGAIDKARLYLERFLNEERVFRDLFFALAS